MIKTTIENEKKLLFNAGGNDSCHFMPNEDKDGCV